VDAEEGRERRVDARELQLGEAAKLTGPVGDDPGDDVRHTVPRHPQRTAITVNAAWPGEGKWRLFAVDQVVDSDLAEVGDAGKVQG